MLSERYDIKFIRKNLIPLELWNPFPPARDRSAWEGILENPLNKERRAYLAGQAETLLDRPWPFLTATGYMQFVREGDRSTYQKAYYFRRQNFAVLVLAECMEHRGRFLDEIANGIWAITEEATWCLPCHAFAENRVLGIAYPGHPEDALPRQDCELVDHAACETVMVLAEAYYLLKDELMALSPALCDRTRKEMIRRIIEPVETRDDIWWMNMTNNWVPWCCSNVLAASMYVIDDLDRLANIAWKLMAIVDRRFIGNYAPDGGCSEGPGYWAVAAGTLLILLELLHSRTNGAIDVYQEPLIANMGRFIADVHLDGPWFANFADASARLEPRRSVVYRYGERVGNEDMKELALLSARSWRAELENDVYPLFHSSTGQALNNMLRELFWFPADTRPKGLTRPRSVWLPDLQVLVAKESKVPGRGLILAAKAGHNGESHNHNDVGQFMVFLDGQPGIIDIGVGLYTKQTFSSQRYEIWCIRSSGHNVPLVNDVEQMHGAEYCATDVSFRKEGITQQLSMNLERAYPKEANLVSLCREFIFDAGPPATITVRDSFESSSASFNIVVPMHSVMEAEEIEPGRLAIQCRPKKLMLEYDPELLKVEIETVTLDDERLNECWGSRLKRLTFTYIGKAGRGSYEFRFLKDTAEERM